jgi:hypothetical protein
MASKIESGNFGDVREFAVKAKIPFAELEKVLKDHHERD